MIVGILFVMFLVVENAVGAGESDENRKEQIEKTIESDKFVCEL